MKKLIALILGVLTICSLAACAGKNDTAAGGNSSALSPDKTQSAEIPNPFVDCDTLEDAQKLADFDFAVPESIDGYDTRTVQAVKDDMIQAVYLNGDNSLLIRKAAGADDISGDSTNYSEINTVAAGGLQVTMKGENGTVSVATWTDGGYTYAVDAQAIPMTGSAMSALIVGVQ